MEDHRGGGHDRKKGRYVAEKIERTLGRRTIPGDAHP